MPDNTEPDEIDRFLATLHIPDQMIDDPDRPRPQAKPPQQLTLLSIFAASAWVILFFSLLTILRAAPRNASMFDKFLDMRPFQSWNSNLLLSAVFYLFANCVVSIGGLLITALKKMKLTGAGAVSQWITLAISAVLAVVLLVNIR